MLTKQIMEDLKTAMKEHDQVKLNTVRLIKSALMNEKIKLGHDLSDEEALQILVREKKQREESIEEFKKGNREDLIEQTKAELAIVEKYLPKQLSKEELTEIVKEAISEAQVSSVSEFGKVMKVLMPKIKGRADGKMATEIVKEQLK
ncbi:MAG: GatB/YqeY domain-containing protein [Lactobacillus sp.]|nr:GatB/YqeY domain-containing protein [Lactobacillus sp.]